MSKQVTIQREDAEAERTLLEEVYLDDRDFQRYMLRRAAEIQKWTVTEKISFLWVLEHKLKRRGIVSLREHATIEILRYIFRNPNKAKAWLSHQFKNVEVGRAMTLDHPQFDGEGLDDHSGHLKAAIVQNEGRVANAKDGRPSAANIWENQASLETGEEELEAGRTPKTSIPGVRKLPPEEENLAKGRDWSNWKYRKKYKRWDSAYEFLTPEDAFRYMTERHNTNFGTKYTVEEYKKVIRKGDLEIAEELRKYRAELARKRKQRQRAKLPKSSRPPGRPKGSKDRTPRTRSVWKRSDAEKNVEIIDVPENPNRLQNARCDVCATQTNLRKMLDKFGEEVYLCESCIEHSVERDTYQERDKTSDGKVAL